MDKSAKTTYACSIYHKIPKNSDTQKSCCNHSKIGTKWLYHRVMHPKDTDRMANSVDSDLSASLRAVGSGSTLFARNYLSENLGSLRYEEMQGPTVHPKQLL